MPGVAMESQLFFAKSGLEMLYKKGQTGREDMALFLTDHGKKVECGCSFSKWRDQKSLNSGDVQTGFRFPVPLAPGSQQQSGLGRLVGSVNMEAEARHLKCLPAWVWLLLFMGCGRWSLRCLWKRREVVLEQTVIQARRDLWQGLICCFGMGSQSSQESLLKLNFTLSVALFVWSKLANSVDENAVFTYNATRIWYESRVVSGIASLSVVFHQLEFMEPLNLRESLRVLLSAFFSCLLCQK